MRYFLLFSILILIICGFGGCEEELIQQNLLKYGIDVRGQNYSLEELKSMLIEIKSQDSNSEPKAPLPEEISKDSFKCAELKELSPRGISCLHCMQPEARTQANVIATTLYRSCLKNIAINYLVDGSFSFDDRLLTNQIDLLTQENRQLYLYFYITNGPAQRRWRSNIYKTLGSKISPSLFREQIRTSIALKEQYKSLVSRLEPIILYAKSRGAIVFIIPMLEDNLDDDAFESMLALTKEALSEEAAADVFYGRNPCPSCYRGNTRHIPEGVFQEIHTNNSKFSVTKGLITNDGYSYCYKAGDVSGSLKSLNNLASVRDKATELNNTFILWHGAMQGLEPKFNGYLPEPKERHYYIPSISERQEIIRFLRQG